MKENVLKLVWDDFKKFANTFAVFALMYGWIACITFCLSLIIPTYLHLWGVPHAVTTMISRILLTITPIIPTYNFVKHKYKDLGGEEYSMDLCFTAWIITIVFAWWIL